MAAVKSRLLYGFGRKQRGLLLRALEGHSTHPPTRLISQCVKHVIPSTYSDKNIPVQNLSEFVMQNWNKYGDKMALKSFDTGRSYTYSQLNDAVYKVASNLRKLGIREGDIVFLFSPNVLEYAVIYLATNMLGAIVTANNPAYTATEIAQAITLSGCKLILTTKDLLPTMEAALRSLQGKHNVAETIVIGSAAGYRPFADLLSGDFSVSSPPELDYIDHIAALPFSSGTTGLPKGVMLSHHNIVSNIIQILESSSVPVTRDDTLAGILPFFHIYGQVVTLLLGLSAGAAVVTMEKFDFKNFLQMIQDDDITMSHIVPPIILGMVKSDLTRDYDLSSLKFITSGAAPLKYELSMQFLEKMPRVELLQGYGLTETSPVVTFNVPGDRNRHGSAGLLLSNVKAKVVDLETEESLPIGREGELYFHGPNIMKGYWRNEEATADCLDNSWFRTGDIGYCDESGYVYIVDRLKELIKYKGFQVAPAELESILIGHPKILDAAVVSIPCDEAGELPRAYIVAKSGADVTDEHIHDYLKERASNHKQLRGGIRRIDEIPKSASGKILRRVLKQQALDDL